MNIPYIKLVTGIRLTVAAFAALTLLSCDSIIYDSEGDCSVHYRVPLRYTRNILSSDALASEVTSVSLYLFDARGRLAYSAVTPVADIVAAGGAVPVDVAPGTYDIIAWARGDSPVSGAAAFAVDNAGSPSAPADLTCSLPAGDGSQRTIAADIHRLYHAMASGVTFPDTYGNVDVVPLDMMKDTNVIRVMLQHYRHEELDKDDFRFAVYDDNAVLAHDNSPIAGNPVVYREWSKKSASASADGTPARDAITSVSTVIADLTTGRLTTATHPVLHVTKSDGSDVLRLPLNDLLVLGKGEHFSHYSDQDFLDRQDQYNLVFLLDDNHSWYSNMGLYVNGWHVVYQNSDI